MRTLKMFAIAVLLVGLVVSPARAYTLLGTKWDPGPNTASSFLGPPKSPGGATWSIMGAGFSDVSGYDPGHLGTTDLITSLGVPGWGTADYEAVIGGALDIWAGASGFSNLGNPGDGGVDAGAPEAVGGHLGDIRVAAWDIGEAGVIAHAFQPGTEAVFLAGGTIAGDLHFDTSWQWADDPTDSLDDADVDFFTIALHELGHSLGLGHSTNRGSVMYPYYSGARRSLSGDDRKGIQALYGKAEEDGTGGGGGHGGGKPSWAGGGGGPNGVGPHSVPEPSTLVLAALGLLVLSVYRCRRRRK